MTSARHTWFALPVALAAAIALAGCSGGGPAPAPSTSSPRVLKVAYVDADFALDPAPQWFADSVAAASKGALRLDFANECCGDGDNRQAELIGGVVAGKWDLGIAGPRDLEDAGARAIGALTAPRLVDSYAAEAAVLTSDVPASLLPSVTGAGVTGIAVLPGVLRRPIGNTRPLLEPADWKGVTFWTVPSTTSAAAIRALGATSSSVANGERDDGLESGAIQGTENAVVWQVNTQHVPNAVLTLNEALWPRFGVVVASRSLKLTSRERQWLEGAAAKVDQRTADVAALDTGAVTEACTAGVRFATASAAQVSATDRAIEPVIAKMESDATTRSAITAIRALKPATLPSEYDVPAGCRAS